MESAQAAASADKLALAQQVAQLEEELSAAKKVLAGYEVDSAQKTEVHLSDPFLLARLIIQSQSAKQNAGKCVEYCLRATANIDIKVTCR